MKTIIVKSPTRVDLAGGTVDLWPINAILGGTTTVNMAINIYTYVELKERNDKKIIVDLTDIEFKKEYDSLIELLNDTTPQVQLIRVQVEFFKPGAGFEIRTKSESPVGGGLGGSSSLCISLINAFLKWSGKEMSDHEMVHLAHNLEAQVLKVPTGTQDYYPAVLGSICIIDYLQDHIHVEKKSMDVEFFKQRGFLVYTGRPHHSGLNNWEVLKAFIKGDEKTVSALKGIRKKAIKLKDAILNSKWDILTDIFQESYELRTKLSSVFTSPEIEKLKKLAHKSGESGIKICGAGGGGCVLVWCAPENRDSLLKVCQKNGFQILEVVPVEHGSRVQIT